MRLLVSLVFRSPPEVVLNCVTVAHRTLVSERDVLHRDISPGNILLGRDGAPFGQRGVLADYDMACHGERPLSQSPSDPKAVSFNLIVEGSPFN